MSITEDIKGCALYIFTLFKTWSYIGIRLEKDDILDSNTGTNDFIKSFYDEIRNTRSPDKGIELITSNFDFPTLICFLEHVKQITYCLGAGLASNFFRDRNLELAFYQRVSLMSNEELTIAKSIFSPVNISSNEHRAYCYYIWIILVEMYGNLYDKRVKELLPIMHSKVNQFVSSKYTIPRIQIESLFKRLGAAKEDITGIWFKSINVLVANYEINKTTILKNSIMKAFLQKHKKIDTEYLFIMKHIRMLKELSNYVRNQYKQHNKEARKIYEDYLAYIKNKLKDLMTIVTKAHNAILTDELDSYSQYGKELLFYKFLNRTQQLGRHALANRQFLGRTQISTSESEEFSKIRDTFIRDSSLLFYSGGLYTPTHKNSYFDNGYWGKPDSIDGRTCVTY